MKRSLIFVVFLLSSCLHPWEEPSPTSVEILRLFCDDFSNYYSFTELKRLNWDSIYTVNSRLIDGTTTSNQLYERLDAIIQSLRDGHVNLYAGARIAYYNFAKGHPLNSRINIKGYVPDLRSVSSFAEIGRVQGTSIFYIGLKSFPSTTDPFAFITEVIKDQNQYSAVIIDIRMNGGGSDLSSRYFASHFYDTKRLYRKIAYKLPGKNAFSRWHFDYLEPVNDTPFLKPVIVLTSKRTFSAAEDFVLSMKTLPHVRTVGDTTGGGSGNPILKELPNGWTFRLSNWKAVTAQDKIYEGIGLFPDVPIWNSKADSLNNRDKILETAIGLLK